MVLFTPNEDNAAPTTQASAPKPKPIQGDISAHATGAYLEGDVTLDQGDQIMIRAERVYYDFTTQRAVMLDATLATVDAAIATAHTGHGIVMPQCNHGGPGRAGAGEELGGLHGLRFYHQRLAVQGSTDLLARLQTTSANLH